MGPAKTKNSSARPSRGVAPKWFWRPSSATSADAAARSPMAVPNMSSALARPVSSGWASRSSICTTSIASIRPFRSKTPSAPWPGWSNKARSALWASARLGRKLFAGLTPCTTRALKIGFVAYSPLGRGLLTGVVDDPAGMSDGDTRRRHPRFATENINHNLSLVRGIEEIAQERHCTLGQLALAWLLAQGKDIVPIPGTKKKERLAENIGALAVELTADDLAQIT